ncbi:pseudouridine synthase [Helicobacter didelphidarum]|uniref:RNA pseudouridylate synthase n=1 Tax=Helicobacter didelphidarum TaxID=2040648 RepID=A0A3D8IN03_9HELI|nr:RluA family pseudouridine synthase [Helicobacter didelphidarum]RDU66380.1 pseudouridine synthase [Helicobacter didelphidarum]
MQILYSFCILHDFSRLDFALSEILDISRSQVSQWIEKNLVAVNGLVAKKSRVLKKGEVITISGVKQRKDCQNLELLKEISIEIIHETNDYIILNKPRDLVVHHAPSVKGITLTDYLKVHNYELSTISGENRFGIVHRLDKDTSGAILVAKNNESHLKFSNMLKNRTMGRIYICVINSPLKENVIIECFLGRNPNDRLKITKLDKTKFPQARDSKSEFRKIMQSKNGQYELIGVRLYSGRTHQIRAHLNVLQRYIYGDMLYSPEKLAKDYKTKMLLHAQLLYFEENVFIAKIPKDLVKFLEENFLDYQNVLESHLTKWQNELRSY